jgi:adenylyl-sulfate kinase
MSGVVAWFTGLSGAGKTTIATRAAALLAGRGLRVATLDGDAVRATRHRHLGFSPEDIRENNRLLAELCREAAGTHDVVLVPVISPFRDARASARGIIGRGFVEVFVNASLDEVGRRDTKGLYARARAGTMPGLIGVSPDVPYEPPLDPDVTLDTERLDPAACAAALVEHLLGAREGKPAR